MFYALTTQRKMLSVWFHSELYDFDKFKIIVVFKQFYVLSGN